jgi:hypothetical protein
MQFNLCVLLLLGICSWLIACLQAVLRAFAHVLATRSTTDVAGDGMHLKERFELFLIVLCDAIVGWDALLGREAKHSRRFLRFLIRHLHTNVLVLVENDGNDGILVPLLLVNRLVLHLLQLCKQRMSQTSLVTVLVNILLLVHM